VTPWQTKPEFGDTPDDDALEQIFEDIRWANSGNAELLEAHLPVISGQPYKLQVLFYGNHAENRRWDIEVEGALAVDEVTSLGVNEAGITPDYSFNAGLVFTSTVISQDSMLDVIFDGRAQPNDGGDRNPIWQAMIVEKLPPLADTDGDGMSDAWETTNFGNLSETATGDPDNDGLTNLREFQTGADPKDVDSDDDGLNDGPEVVTHLTDPKRADTDGDGLSDGAEVNTHHTNPKDPDSDHDTLPDGEEVTTDMTDPAKIDTDNDGFNDPTEIMNGTSPTSAASKPGNTYIVRVLGGDSQAEGLDLDGTFLYAFNVGTNGAAGKVRDADFTDDAQPGITWVADNEIGSWDQVNFGDTQNDDNLETVYHSIRWTDAANGDPVTLDVSLDGLTPGGQYKLQLLFGEQCCANRGFDVLVEGEVVVDEFNTAPAQVRPNHPYAGGAIVHTLTAPDATLDIVLDGPSASFGDHNAILSGLTLETLTGGSTVPFRMTTITRTPTPPAGASIVLNFLGAASKRYALDFSTNLVTWGEVSDSVMTNASGVGTFTDTLASRTDGVQVYYRARDPVVKPTP